jgi:hypothetical protein
LGANLPFKCLLNEQLVACSRCLAAAFHLASSPLLLLLSSAAAQAAVVLQSAPLLLLVNFGAE